MIRWINNEAETGINAFWVSCIIEFFKIRLNNIVMSKSIYNGLKINAILQRNFINNETLTQFKKLPTNLRISKFRGSVRGSRVQLCHKLILIA